MSNLKQERKSEQEQKDNSCQIDSQVKEQESTSVSSSQKEELDYIKQTTESQKNRQYFPIVLSDVGHLQNTSFWRGYRRLWPFLKPYFFLAVLGIVLTIPVGALDAVVALFLKPFTDKVMVVQDPTFATQVPLIIIGFTLLQGIFIYLSALVNGYVSGAVNLSIRKRLYQKLLFCDSRFFDVNNSGSIIQRFNSDIETATAGMIQNLKVFLTKMFSSLSLIAVMIYNSWQLTLFAVGVVCVLILPMQIVRKRIKSIVRRTVSTSTELLTSYNETTGGAKVIKSYNLKQSMFERFSNKATYLFKMNFKLVRDTSWLPPLMHLVSALGVAGVLYFGVTLIVNETLTSGEFVSFVAALIMLYTPLKNIGNNYINVQNALLALDRIYEVLELKSYEEESTQGKEELKEIKKDIKFKDVYFSYTGEKDILNGINFDVKVGQKVALVGNSGGGKSTVCSLISRLYEIRSGQILIDGKDIRDFNLESLRSQIAFVFQDNFLFQGSLRENILLGKADATEEEIKLALKSSYLDDFVASLPDGLDTLIGERGMSLSGGQKQRLAIARAIIRNAPLVILDEATSALDNKSEKVVQKALDELMKGRTTIVIAHRLSTIQDADKILVINDGQVVEEGTHEDLLAKEGAYTLLYRSQFAKTHESSSEQECD